MRTFIRSVVDIDDPSIDITRLSKMDRIKTSIRYKWHNSSLYLSRKDNSENAKLEAKMKKTDDLKNVLFRILTKEFKPSVESIRISVDRSFDDVISDALDSVDFIGFEITNLQVNKDYLVAFPDVPIMLEVKKKVL